MTGQGFDAQFSISGSYSGFVNVVPKSQKRTSEAKKKLLMDGQGITRGYKYYDPMETQNVELWVEGTTGNTGTLQQTEPAIGATVAVTNAVDTNLNGNWSLDKIDSTGQVEEVKVVGAALSRYAGTTVS